jgi:preprotein translocase subunit SecG
MLRGQPGLRAGSQSFSNRETRQHGVQGDRRTLQYMSMTSRATGVFLVFFFAIVIVLSENKKPRLIKKLALDL